MSADEIKLMGKPKASKIEKTIWPDASLICPEFTNPIQFSKDANGVHVLAQAGDQVNYRWEMNSGTGWQPIFGTPFKSIVSTLTILNNAEQFNGYKFRCIAFNDCPTVSNEYLFNNLSAINELTDLQNNTFIVYPNPSRQTVTIDFLQSPLKYDICIYSILGVEVYKQLSVMGKCQVNLAKGTYLVKATNTYTSEYKRLIIKD